MGEPVFDQLYHDILIIFVKISIALAQGKLNKSRNINESFKFILVERFT
jgi:hypothetical protein